MTATSPYLNAAARRISAQIIPLRAPVYATTAQFPQKFARSRTDGLPLEKTAPISPAWKDSLAGALIFVVFIGSIITVWT